jgi:hypothetical protein
LTSASKFRKLSIPRRRKSPRPIDTFPETTMADNKNDKKNQKPKDLPAKPVDKKADDKVKGGFSNFKITN